MPIMPAAKRSASRPLVALKTAGARCVVASKVLGVGTGNLAIKAAILSKLARRVYTSTGHRRLVVKPDKIFEDLALSKHHPDSSAMRLWFCPNRPPLIGSLSPLRLEDPPGPF